MLWLVTHLKKIVDLSFEVAFEDELKFIGNHIVNTLIMLCDNDDFMRKRCEKKRRRRWRKVMNKLERLKLKMTKRLTSPICSLKRIIGMMKSELEGIDLERFRCERDVGLYICIYLFYFSFSL